MRWALSIVVAAGIMSPRPLAAADNAWSIVVFQSETKRFFPLTDAEQNRLAKRFR